MSSDSSKKQLQKIVNRCRSGDDAAWHKLMDFVAPIVLSICRKARLNRDESFDIFGQVSLQLIDSINSLREPERILSFVTTMVKRQIYSFYQKLPIGAYVDEDVLGDIPDESTQAPDETYELIQTREILFAAMTTLSPRDYELIYMLFFDPDEPSYKEISRKLKMPVSSIGPIRAKALAKLQKLLKSRKSDF